MVLFNSRFLHGGIRYALASMVALAGLADRVAAQQKPGGKPPLVKTVTLEPTPISRVLHLTGDIVSTNEVSIRSTLDGPVGFCPWREGDTFAKDDRLVEIHRPVYASEVAVTQATLAVERARLADLHSGARPEEIQQAGEAVKQLEECAGFAGSDLKRIGELVDKGSIPGEAVEKARVAFVNCRTQLVSAQGRMTMLEAGPTATEIAVQDAKVSEAEARLAMAEARLAECRIHAPFDGIVTAVHVRPGDMATAKAPLLDIRARDGLVVRFTVPERVSAQVVEGVLVVARLDAQPTKTHNGTVVRVYPQLDRASRTQTVEAALPAADGLAPGMFARLEVLVETIRDALVVPDSAVMVRAGKGHVVAVVVEGKAELRPVHTGIEVGGKVQILDGLAAGDRVVIEGNQKLKPGTAVRMPGAGGKKPSASAAETEGGGNQ